MEPIQIQFAPLYVPGYSLHFYGYVLNISFNKKKTIKHDTIIKWGEGGVTGWHVYKLPVYLFSPKGKTVPYFISLTTHPSPTQITRDNCVGFKPGWWLLGSKSRGERVHFFLHLVRDLLKEMKTSTGPSPFFNKVFEKTCLVIRC